jgi:predicted HicB family RNase H-like nuclease
MPKNKSIRQPGSPTFKAEDYYYSVAWSEEDKSFVGRVAEFASIAAHGPTLQKGLRETITAVQGVLEDLADSGETLPVPFSKRSYSGRVNVRMPEHLHRRLVIEAEQQNLSLNRWINTKLEMAVE